MATLHLGPQGANPGLLNKLTEEFGFPYNFAKRALEATRNAGLPEAIEWMDQHREQEELAAAVASATSAPVIPGFSPVTQDATTSGISSVPLSPDVASHPTFTLESRYSRAEAERHSFQEEQRRKQAREDAARRRKQLEDERLIKERIAADARARRQKAKGSPVGTPAPTAAKAAVTPQPVASKADGSTPTAIRARLPSGQAVNVSLTGADTVATLYERVREEGQLTQDFFLLVPYPRRRLDAVEHGAQTLLDAQLVPRAALNVMLEGAAGKVVAGQGPVRQPHRFPRHYDDDDRSADDDDDDVDDGGDDYDDDDNQGAAPVGPPSQILKSKFFKEDGADAVTCVVCQGEVDHGDDISTLPCLHYFHSECIDMWFTRDTSCPTCKANA